jgi:carnitine 3-dehydrogenase
MSEIKNIAVIGGGVIGAGWVARFLENSINVTVYDSDPHARDKIDVVLDNADYAYQQLFKGQRRNKGKLSFSESLASAVQGAQLVVESVPEVLEIKQTVYAEIENAAADDALIVSSTSGILPSELQKKMRKPERFLVAHPFNPVYLLPVVELVGGNKSSDIEINNAAQFYTSLGMYPVKVRKEIPAFIADRLLEAVWRESLWLVKDDVATTEEIDDVIRFGFGLRWAQMGLFETYRIAGGEGGMEHFLHQFGPCLQWPWTRLMDVT